MSGRLLFALALVLLAAPSRVAADDGDRVGHLSISGGVMLAEEAGSYEARPQLRAELAFDLHGPIAAGGWAQVVLSDRALDQPAFGGGLLVTLRPELPLLGFVPHLELTGGRVQLQSLRAGVSPQDWGSPMTMVDAWSLGVGGGAGGEVVEGISVEARAHHDWYFGIPSHAALASSAWTVGAAITIDLP